MSFRMYFGLWVICFFNFYTQTGFAVDENDKTDLYKLSGDMKYRFQTIKEQDKEQRPQQRLQAKMTLESKPDPNLSIYFQLLTGTSATSSSQTLGDENNPGMPRRSFGLNWAFFDSNLYEKIHLIGGKMPLPFNFVGKHQLFLDKDLSPEGLALKSEFNPNEDFKLFLNAAHFQIKEQYDSNNNKDLTDNQLNGIQMQLEYKIEMFVLSMNLGSFGFINFRDNHPTITGNAKSNTDSHNNTLDLSDNYPTNFDIKEQGLELKIKLDPDWGNLSLSYSHLRNEDISLLNQAQFLGLNYQIKSWSFGWQQLKIEKDAIVGAYMDSDFNNGNTSTKGTIISFGYKINKYSQLAFTQYNCVGQIDTDSPRSYFRNHIDYSVNF